MIREQAGRLVREQVVQEGKIAGWQARNLCVWKLVIEQDGRLPREKSLRTGKRLVCRLVRQQAGRLVWSAGKWSDESRFLYFHESRLIERKENTFADG